MTDGHTASAFHHLHRLLYLALHTLAYPTQALSLEPFTSVTNTGFHVGGKRFHLSLKLREHGISKRGTHPVYEDGLRIDSGGQLVYAAICCHFARGNCQAAIAILPAKSRRSGNP